MPDPVTIKSTCCYCGVGCGVEVTRDGAGGLSVSGDEEYPVNEGMLCSKGRNLHQVAMDRDRRLRRPMMRPRPGMGLEETDWDPAMDRIARTFRRLIDTYGPKSVAFYVSGQFTTEEYYVANKLMKGYVGANNIDTNSRLCMSSAIAGYQDAVGEDAPPISYADIEACDCFFITGANPAWCHPILFRRIERRKEANPNTKIIVADPRKTDTASIADLYLPVRPGSDVTLFNAIASELIANDWIDRSFIEDHVEGFEALRDEVDDVDPARAARSCGVPSDDVRKAARWIGRSPTFLSMWAMGLNQSSRGTDKNRALINLSLLTGQIGKKGSGPFSLTGQPNAMGGREVGGMATKLAAHRDLSDPDHRAEVADFWGVEEISPNPGYPAAEMIDALESGELKAVWIMCTNPVVSMPDAGRVERVLEHAELTVVQEISADADTIGVADVVLPAASWLEKEGTMTNSERRISHLPRVIDPPGQARPEAEILCDFARRMGWGDAFDYEDASEIYAEYAALTAGTSIDVSGLSYERLEEERSVQWPCPSEDHPGTERLFENGRFFTDSGRARLHAVRSEESTGAERAVGSEPPSEKMPAGPGGDGAVAGDDVLPEEAATSDRRPADGERAASEAYPLVLTTGRVRDQWHTMTKTGTVNRLRQHVDEPALQMHSHDAEERGLEDGATVHVRSGRGEVEVPLAVTDRIRRGVVFLPMHWGTAICDGRGRANNLTEARVDPVSRQPAFKFTPVEVEPVDREPERIVVVGAGAAARQFVESFRRHRDEDELVVFGREPERFYNRVLLPEYISGHRPWSGLRTSEADLPERLDIEFHRGVEVVGIDREDGRVLDENDRWHDYDRLVLSTGSRAFEPPGMPTHRGGIFSLRSRSDADAIQEHLDPDEPVVIIGGGLLGLELAAEIHRMGLACTVVEAEEHLMHRQLDPTASELLREELEERGIEVITGDLVNEYPGDGEIEEVRTLTGRELPCQALFVAVGTRPNVEIAEEAGLETDRGVVVDDHLRTSDPSIYAIGEIAQHRGELYGITPVANEQAEIAAAHAAGDRWARYEGSVNFNLLKIHGLDVCAAGTVEVPEEADGSEYEEIVLLDRRKRYYKKCVVRDNRLVGAVLIGDQTEFAQYRYWIAEGLELNERREDLLRPGTASAGDPPDGPLVCSCHNVGEGDLEKLIEAGTGGLEELRRESRAGTGCGSCIPELKMMLEDAETAEAASVAG